MFQFKQSEATADRRRIFFYAVDATDGYTAITASITSGVVLIVKNGNTPGTSPVSPTFTHISNGLWYYEMTASHLDTQGVVSVTITGSNIRTVQLIGYVYSGDPMAAIPTFPTNFSSLAITVGGAVTAGTVGDKTGYSLATGAITSTTFGADAITASVIANGAIDAATFAADAITATVIANGAIDAATFATGAINAAAIAADALTSAKFADGALIIGATTGTGVKISHGVNSITAGVIADAAIDAATFADSALVIGSAAAGGVKAYLGAGSITAGVVATGAIDADAIASAAITSAKFAGDAINASVIANGAIDAATFAAGAIDAAAIATGAIDADAIAADAITSAKIANSAISIRLATDGTASEARIETGTVAADVWNALLASYAVNNSFGERVLRSTTSQSTCAVTGSNHIAADIHELQAGVITAGDFSADAINANALAADAATEIATATWTADISGISVAGQAGRYLTDAAVSASNASASASIIEATAYKESVADILLGRNLAGGSNTGRLVKEALYALRNKSEIVGSTLNVYNATDGGIAWSATVASSGSAVPVTGIDPA